jgi:2-oxoglutarate dehydrogenase E1 component
MVLFSPKSLLRYRPSFGSIDALTAGTFRKLIDDPQPPEEVRRVVLCTGKIYYDLVDERRARDESSVALVRLEQLYPYPERHLRAVLERYPGAEVTWVQEEPANMGAWPFLRTRLASTVDQAVPVFARSESASPATGSHKRHLVEQEELVAAALVL